MAMIHIANLQDIIYFLLGNFHSTLKSFSYNNRQKLLIYCCLINNDSTLISNFVHLKIYSTLPSTLTIILGYEFKDIV